MKGQKLDELLRQALQSLRPSVEDDDWERLAASLDNEIPSAGSKSGFGWIVTATLVVSGMLLWLIPSLDTSTQKLSMNQKVKSVPSSSEIKNTVGIKDSFIHIRSVERGQRAETRGTSPAPVPGIVQNDRNELQKKTSNPDKQNNNILKDKKNELIGSRQVIPSLVNLKRANKKIPKAEEATAPAEKLNTGTPSDNLVNTSDQPTINPSKESVKSDSIKEQVSNVIVSPDTNTVEKKTVLEIKSDTSDSTITATQKPGTNKDVFSKGWLVGISVSPQFAFRSFGMNGANVDKAHKNYEKIRNGQDKPMPSFAVNLYAECKISGSLGFQTGVSYSQGGYMAQYNYKVNEVPVIDSATRKILGYVQVNDQTGTKLSQRQTFSYMEIPFLVGYSFKVAPKWRMGIRTGGSIQKLQMVNATIINPATLQLTRISKNEQILRSTNFSYQLALGVYYAIKPKIYVMAEPVFKKSVNPLMNNQSLSREMLFSYGMNMGIMYKLF